MKDKSRRFMEFLEEKLVPFAMKINEQKHLKAIKGGILTTTPLIIIGSIALILSFPPGDISSLQATNIFNRFLILWHNWARINRVKILIPYHIGMGIIALVATCGIAYRLANTYKEEYSINSFSSSIIAAVVFLLISTSAEKGNIIMEFLGFQGLFTGMVVGILTVEITRLILSKKIHIKLPDEIPSGVITPFIGLLPIVVNILFFGSIDIILKLIIKKGIAESIIILFSPIINMVDSLWFILIVVGICHILWFAGVHGVVLVEIITFPFYTYNILGNAAAKVGGISMKYIGTGPLWSYIIYLGGSGATLALATLMLRSKSTQLKSVGKVGIYPGLFNINEPILFGTPLILNPIMGIPLVLAPMVNAAIAYMALKLEFIGKIYILTPWTTPGPIGFFLSNMDWRSLVLWLGIFIINMVIYYPFFKVYERTLVLEEIESN